MYKVYKFVITYNDIISHYTIHSNTLVQAINQVKIEFGKKFNVIGSDINIRLEINDIKNHIDEILQNIVCDG